MPTDKFSSVIQLHSQGYRNPEISRRVPCCPRYVSYCLRKAGKTFNLARTRINHEYLDWPYIKCPECNTARHEADFKYGTRRVSSSICKSCRVSKHSLAKKKTLKAYLNERRRTIAVRCRKAGLPFDIPVGFLDNLYVKQEGLCFYTSRPLSWGGPLSQNSLSIDKVVPRLGYVSGNVVLCTAKANSVKSNITLEELLEWIPSWHQKLKDSGIV